MDSLCRVIGFAFLFLLLEGLTCGLCLLILLNNILEKIDLISNCDSQNKLLKLIGWFPIYSSELGRFESKALPIYPRGKKKLNLSINIMTSNNYY